MRLKPADVGLYLGAEIGDVGLGGEVVVDRFEACEALFDGGHGSILA